MIPMRLLATGKALPSQRITAERLDRMLGAASGYSFRRGGVRVRHFAAAEETQSRLGAAALQEALRHASLKADSIDLLIAACGVPEQALPNTACFIAEQAGLKRGTPAFDVNASCLGFMTALRVASGLLETGGYRRVAVVSSDLASRGINWSDPESSLIFGDGAAAVLLERGHAHQGIQAFKMETYPEARSYCEIRGGGTRRNPRMGAEAEDYLFRMNGKAVFKLVSKIVPGFLRDLMAPVAGGLSSVDVVVPHQASHLGMAHISSRLGLPASSIVNIYESHGNQVAASIPTALHEAVAAGRIRAGNRVLLLGTAAGLTVGGMVLDL